MDPGIHGFRNTWIAGLHGSRNKWIQENIDPEIYGSNPVINGSRNTWIQEYGLQKYMDPGIYGSRESRNRGVVEV